MSRVTLLQGQAETARHRTAYLEAGPADGPLMIFVHGWPELGLVWRAQMEHFASLGWRCIAPDMRGYGGSSRPDSVSAYTLREIVGDMVELHDALGAGLAVWVGHDWGSPVAWSMASHHPDRCRAVANLCVPYVSRGMALPSLIPLVDRELYPLQEYPVGQWDYWLFYREHFEKACAQLEDDPAATLAMLYRAGSAKAVGRPAPTAKMRENGGWFGPSGKAPQAEQNLLSEDDFETMVATFRSTGFRGANAWYLNDFANLQFAGEAVNFGRLTLPVLFLHAEYDTVCETAHGRLAAPMREDCANLTEATIEAGHESMLEKPDEVNVAIEEWLEKPGLQLTPGAV